MENKENMFTRFMNFIKNLFGNKETKKIPEKTEINIKQEQKSSFMDEIRVYKEEDSTLLKLQNQFENDEIGLCVMSNEQIHELNSLYKRQVAELQKKLRDKKMELNMMQNKMKNYSTNI